MKKRKTFLTWAGVVSFLCAAFFIYCLIIVSLNVGDINSIIKNMVDASYPEIGESYLSLIKTYFIISIIADLIFGVIFIIYSRYTDIRFNKSKTSLMVVTVINVIIGMNLVSLILVLFALFTAPTITPEVQVQNVSEDPFFDMAEKITSLKQKLNRNEISEEEYKNELKKVVEIKTETPQNFCEYCGAKKVDGNCPNCGANKTEK